MGLFSKKYVLTTSMCLDAVKNLICLCYHGDIHHTKKSNLIVDDIRCVRLYLTIIFHKNWKWRHFNQLFYGHTQLIPERSSSEVGGQTSNQYTSIILQDNTECQRNGLKSKHLMNLDIFGQNTQILRN